VVSLLVDYLASHSADCLDSLSVDKMVKLLERTKTTMTGFQWEWSLEEWTEQKRVVQMVENSEN
jgi:hypothetical protein